MTVRPKNLGDKYKDKLRIRQRPSLLTRVHPNQRRARSRLRETPRTQRFGQTNGEPAAGYERPREHNDSAKTTESPQQATRDPENTTIRPKQRRARSRLRETPRTQRFGQNNGEPAAGYERPQEHNDSAKTTESPQQATRDPENTMIRPKQWRACSRLRETPRTQRFGQNDGEPAAGYERPREHNDSAKTTESPQQATRDPENTTIRPKQRRARSRLRETTRTQRFGQNNGEPAAGYERPREHNDSAKTTESPQQATRDPENTTIRPKQRRARSRLRETPRTQRFGQNNGEPAAGYERPREHNDSAKTTESPQQATRDPEN